MDTTKYVITVEKVKYLLFDGTEKEFSGIFNVSKEEYEAAKKANFLNYLPNDEMSECYRDGLRFDVSDETYCLDEGGGTLFLHFSQSERQKYIHKLETELTRLYVKIEGNVILD